MSYFTNKVGNGCQTIPLWSRLNTLHLRHVAICGPIPCSTHDVRSHMLCYHGDYQLANFSVIFLHITQAVACQPALSGIQHTCTTSQLSHGNM